MNKDLDAKARVALDLLAQGAEEVEIIGTDIKVSRRRTLDKPHDRKQIVYVNVHTSANSTVNIATTFSILQEELREIFKGNNKLSELEDKIKQIEVELKKKSSDKSNLKKLLHWILDFDFDTFLKIASIIWANFS